LGTGPHSSLMRLTPTRVAAAADRQTHMYVLMTARVARLAVTDKAVVSVRTLLVLRAIVMSVCALILCWTTTECPRVWRS